MAKYQVNQLFYYSGDGYNPPGLFKVTSVKETNEHYPTRYDLKELAGERKFHGTNEAGMADSYDGKKTHKLVTVKAYDDYMLERHEQILRHRNDYMAKYDK